MTRLRWFLVGCFAGAGVLAAVLLAPAAAGPGGARWLSVSPAPSVIPESLVEMSVETVGISRVSQQPVILLKDKSGGVLLPVLVGPLEAEAVAMFLEGLTPPRPLTSDLLLSVIGTMDAKVEHVAIIRLSDGIFYATITLRKEDGRVDIDARPSDAIGLALRAGAVIYADRAVLDKAGVTPEGRPARSSSA